jgi:GGDEF domain-containing protein
LLCGDGCPAEAAMKDGRIVDACVLTHHKQGHRIPILVRAIPLRDEKGAVVGAAACFDRQAIPEVSGATENETFLPLDENTGLPDKDFSYTFLAAKLRRLTPDSRRFTVVRFEMAELENLRKSLGKEAIPAILKPLAETLKAAIRPPDYLGMWNNAGFLMVLGTGRDNPPEITSLRYKNLAEATSISWWGDRLIPITNVKATIAQAGDTVESLIARLNKMP